MLQRKTSSPASAAQKLLTLDFVLLFFLALFSNCYLAVYYCFEQWLVKVSVDPNWRGLLLGILFGTLLIARPCAIVFLLKRNKLPIVLAALLVSSGVLFSYQFLDPASPSFEWTVLGMRILQGIFLALFSTSVVSVLVSCIPPGQSARGFALFSITFLLPYGIIPTLGEYLLTIVGDEPHLYSLTGFLLLPCLIMTGLLAKRLKRPEVSQRQSAHFGGYLRKLIRGVTHSGLGLVYSSMVCFSLGTSTCIFFMKGLCTQTGGNPASFFFFYTMTIIVVRVFGSTHLDKLRPTVIVPLTACTMSAGVFLIAWAPLWAYIPATICYGLSLSLLYPLTASVVYNRSTSETRTVNSNLMMLTFDLAALCSPMIGGGVISLGFDYHVVVSVAGCMILFCGLLFSVDGQLQKRKAAAKLARRLARAQAREHSESA